MHDLGEAGVVANGKQVEVNGRRLGCEARTTDDIVGGQFTSHHLVADDGREAQTRPARHDIDVVHAPRHIGERTIRPFGRHGQEQQPSPTGFASHHIGGAERQLQHVGDLTDRLSFGAHAQAVANTGQFGNLNVRDHRVQTRT